MRKFLFAALLVVLAVVVGMPAEAGWNLRQNEDGTTDWVRTGVGNSEETHAVGTVIVHGYVSDIGLSQTFGIAVPITNAKITRIQAVVQGQLSGTQTVIRFFRSSNVSGGISTADEVTTGSPVNASWGTVTEVTNGTSPMALTAAGSTGAIFTFTPALAAAIKATHAALGNSPSTIYPNNTVTLDQVILIRSDGAGSGGLGAVVPAEFYITLTPR